MSSLEFVGGYLYAHIGIDKPGLVDRYIIKSLRQAYVEDTEFREFIDNLNPSEVKKEIYASFSEACAHDPRLSRRDLDMIEELITLDTTTFLQNMLQVPMQIGPELSEAWGKETMTEAGLIDVRRPQGTYWLRNDFRRFLAPIHFVAGRKSIATLFYGNGHVKLTARKA